MKTNTGTPYWLSTPAMSLFGLMVLFPLLLTFFLSFQRFDHQLGIVPGYTLDVYRHIINDPFYWEVFGRTAWVSLTTTMLCVLIGAPEAYVLSRMRAPWRSFFLVIILSPLLISVVVRAFGWSLVLGPTGLLNSFLQSFGLDSVRILYTPTAVIIALVHVMLPFMVIPVWTSLQKLDPQIENAALSLGASKVQVWWRVVLPQITPGLLSGALIIFALSASAFAIPGLVGGRRVKMVATLIYDEYLHELNWPLGAAIALILLLVNLLVMYVTQALVEGRYARRMGS